MAIALSTPPCRPGFSSCGHFVGFALLTRPAAFGRYLASSHALSAYEDVLFTLEADYATTHDDLAATVFFGAARLSSPNPTWPAPTSSGR